MMMRGRNARLHTTPHVMLSKVAETVERMTSVVAVPGEAVAMRIAAQ